MYICASCKNLQAPRVPKVMVIIAERKRIYDYHNDGPCNEKDHKKCHHGPITHQSLGSEIVKEIGVCPKCLPEPEGHA